MQTISLDLTRNPIVAGNQTFLGWNAVKLAREYEWDTYFLGMAGYVATKSKDRSTKVGAVITSTEDHAVLSTGWNGFPRGVDDNIELRHTRPEKYYWTEHAERNAVYNAARRGIPLLGATIYVTLMPCCDCARAIIQTGIGTLVTVEPDRRDEHRLVTTHHDVSTVLLREAGVEVRFVK